MLGVLVSHYVCMQITFVCNQFEACLLESYAISSYFKLLKGTLSFKTKSVKMLSLVIYNVELIIILLSGLIDIFKTEITLTANS